MICLFTLLWQSQSCLRHYRVPDKVKIALCSDFFHCVLSTSALLNGKNFILWMSLRIWDILKSILFKEHTHTSHKHIPLKCEKRLAKRQSSVSHSVWNSPFVTKIHLAKSGRTSIIADIRSWEKQATFTECFKLEIVSIYFFFSSLSQSDSALHQKYFKGN